MGGGFDVRKYNDKLGLEVDFHIELVVLSLLIPYSKVKLILEHLTFAKELSPCLFCYKRMDILYSAMLCLVQDNEVKYLKIPECIHPIDLVMDNAPEALLLFTAGLFPLNIEGRRQSVSKEGFNRCLGK